MICLKVKEVAASKQISLSRLSRRADLDVTHLRRIYQHPCSANITLETLNKLAWALGVTPCDLMDYTPDERIHEG